MSQQMGPEIERLIQVLSRLPGLGPRSARRATLTLLKKRSQLLEPLVDAATAALKKVVTCQICGNLDTISPCSICADTRRDIAMLVVVEDVADLWAFERAQILKCPYHVLGGTLSALDGVRPEDLNISSLQARIDADGVKEVILALNATIEGQTTAHYITDVLAPLGIKITRLAAGVPIGGELDYLDEGTLQAAVRGRQLF